MQVKRIIENLAAWAGFSLVPNWRVAGLDGERHLRQLLAFLDVDCVFDVGANDGGFARMLRGPCVYRGRIISFEPNPTVFLELARAAADDPLWDVEQLALGARAGPATFQAYDISTLASLRSLKDTPHAPARIGVREVAVEVERTDRYLRLARERLGFRRPFRKMDTQGFDLEVARGAGEMLRDFVGLQSEVAFQTLYEDAPDYRSAIDFYEAAGFRLSRLVPIHELHFPTLVEMDAIMVRDDLISGAGAR